MSFGGRGGHAGSPGKTSGAVAVYARLSVNENGERDESLETQCDLLTGFVRENGMGEARVYVDNNRSGTTFDRPGLMQMVEDIKNRLVEVVVVKDLSRLGRNNGETLLFLDFLKENNVRLISLGDNYDSGIDDDEIIGIKTWVNEHYARDISKKVRVNIRKKMQSGEFLARPHFGYVKSEREKNRLVVDERYRQLIRQIFDLYIAGWGYRALADYVQSRGIPTPSQDKNYPGAKKSARWNEQHIRRIITSRVYCGDSVQGRHEKLSFKSKKVRKLPPEKWVIVKDTHEAIIPREIFELAQAVRLKRRQGGQGRKQKGARQHLLTGFLVCAACGSRLVFRWDRFQKARYRCGRYEKFGRKENGCSAHTVLEETVVECLVEDLARIAGDPVFPERLIEEYGKSRSVLAGRIAGEINRLSGRLAEKKRQRRAAYLDLSKGVISPGLFSEVVMEMEKEIALLSEDIARLEKDLAGSVLGENRLEQFKGMKLKLMASDIDRAFLERFLKVIIVCDREEICGRVREEHGLDRLLTEEQRARAAAGQFKLIILYDLQAGSGPG
ncbi:MAG: recombinase family protein [Firmicutes bacterium]|nr:recombinase family protein [Bacillota bacterium]